MLARQYRSRGRLGIRREYRTAARCGSSRYVEYDRHLLAPGSHQPLLGFPVAYAIVRKRPHLRLIGFTMAGFVALIAIHVIIKAVVGISGVAPTRTLLGLLCQGIAGGVGGYLFYRLSSNLQSY